LSDDHCRASDGGLVAAPYGSACVGVWLRVLATVLDSLPIVAVTLPLVMTFALVA
jgi:hypothetical protein